MDAIAITLTMNGTHTGVAPLGTALTEPQAAQLVAMHSEPVIATDADDAGRAAAERDFWLVAAHRGDARHANLPESSDPASLVADRRAAVVRTVLADAAPLAFQLIACTSSQAPYQLARATFVLSATAPQHWPAGEAMLVERTQATAGVIRSALASAVAI